MLGSNINGVTVGYVDPSGPASGIIYEGDVIVNVNEQKITSVKELIAIISNSKPGTSLNFSIIRNGKKINVDVTLTEDKTVID